MAHFTVAAVERARPGAVAVQPNPGGTAQHHPRLLPALLICACASRTFSSYRIEPATHRDPGVRHVAANLHSVHDAIAAFRRASHAAFVAAFPQVLLPARERGMLGPGGGASDAARLNTGASRIRSARHGRAKELRAGPVS